MYTPGSIYGFANLNYAVITWLLLCIVAVIFLELVIPVSDEQFKVDIRPHKVTVLKRAGAESSVLFRVINKPNATFALSFFYSIDKQLGGPIRAQVCHAFTNLAAGEHDNVNVTFAEAAHPDKYYFDSHALPAVEGMGAEERFEENSELGEDALDYHYTHAVITLKKKTKCSIL